MRKAAMIALGATLFAFATFALANSAFADPAGPVKIGVLTDMSGPYADTGGRWSVVAAQMAIDDFGGEALGKKIELLSADHQDKPDIGSSIARRWYDVDGVDMITDLTTSSVALAIHQLGREKKKIDIVVGAGTSRLTGDSCSPYGFHWAYDTHALGVGTGGALVEQGGKTWFFLTADYAFGYSLQKDTTKVVESKGGKVLGAVRHPLNTTDFSSFLLQAQSSGAKVVGLADAGLDTVNAIKQAGDFGIISGGQKIAALLFTISEVHGLGLQAAQGIALTESYYWDLNDKTRRFGKRFFAKTHRMPNMTHAGTYSATLAYLRAVKAAGTKDPDKVAAKLHELPVDDDTASNAHVIANGRLVRDMFLFEVKSPAESKAPWDYYRLVATIPGETAYMSAKESGCSLVK